MLAYVIFFHTTLLRVFRGGPSNFVELGIERCRDSWWRHLLYFTNYEYEVTVSPKTVFNFDPSGVLSPPGVKLAPSVELCPLGVSDPIREKSLCSPYVLYVNSLECSPLGPESLTFSEESKFTPGGQENTSRGKLHPRGKLMLIKTGPWLVSPKRLYFRSNLKSEMETFYSVNK
jgi:hypothetical protein